jgi:hypothetical protein
MSGQGSGSGGPRRSDRLAKGRLCFTLETAPLIQMTSMMPWRTYVLVLMHLSPGTCRQSLMPRLLVWLLVLFGLLLGLVSLLAVVLGPLVHLASLMRRRQLLFLPDRRGRDLTALLFPRIPYRRIMLHRGSDILPRVAFDRAIPSPLRWWIHHS